MKPIWRRIGSEIVILADCEYRFSWQDADIASALFQSLLGDYEVVRQVAQRTKEEQS